MNNQRRNEIAWILDYAELPTNRMPENYNLDVSPLYVHKKLTEAVIKFREAHSALAQVHFEIGKLLNLKQIPNAPSLEELHEYALLLGK